MEEQSNNSKALKLKKKINERLESLGKILPFAKEVLTKLGIKKFHQVHDFHTHSVIELKNFYYFSIIGDFGQSQFGGNNIYISYQGRPVLNVYSEGYSFGLKECKVIIFDQNKDWQDALTIIIDEKEKYIADFQKKQKKEITNKRTQPIVEESVFFLKQEAERLRIDMEK